MSRNIKNIIKYASLVLTLFFGYLMYDAVMTPMLFKKVKIKRYGEVIESLKKIKKAEDAYKTIKGRYTGSFENLIRFIDSAEFVTVQQRDTSWVEYDEAYRIDVLKEGTVIDTLGFVSVRDSLFKNNDDYKKMMYVPQLPGVPEGTRFEIKTGLLEKAGMNLSTYRVQVAKRIILSDQDPHLLELEEQIEGFEEINGSYITLGSLEELSSNGNWPSRYD